MKNDNLIKEKMSMLQDNIDYFNSFINPCASQDRALENIIDTVKEIENLHYSRFDEKVSRSKTR